MSSSVSMVSNRLDFKFLKTDYKTVASKVQRINSKADAEAALFHLLRKAA